MNVALLAKSALVLAGYAGLVGGVLVFLSKKFPQDPVNSTAPSSGDANGTEPPAGEAENSRPSWVSVLRCKGGSKEAAPLYKNRGPRDCRQQYILFRGDKACGFGCLGGFHCVGVCPNGAIQRGAQGLPVIDFNKCKGCGECVRECPRRVLELVNRAHLIYLACNARIGPAVKELCTVGCTACAVCVEECPHAGAITMADQRPTIRYEKCTSCGICYRKCPVGSFIDRAKTRPYALISLQCDGCGDCKRLCQFEAIQGQLGKRHQVLKEKCIGCGRCFEVCPIRVITMVGALGYTQVA
jgi:electron transport complex protein RnfB